MRRDVVRRSNDIESTYDLMRDETSTADVERQNLNLPTVEIRMLFI